MKVRLVVTLGIAAVATLTAIQLHPTSKTTFPKPPNPVSVQQETTNHVTSGHYQRCQSYTHQCISTAGWGVRMYFPSTDTYSKVMVHRDQAWKGWYSFTVDGHDTDGQPTYSVAVATVTGPDYNISRYGDY